MHQRSFQAVVLIALLGLSAGAVAQNTFKCGDSYGQTPCPGGVVIDGRDSRSGAQKAQTDAAIARDARMADAMEKARLKQEALAREANAPSAKPAATATPAAGGKTSARKKDRPPEYFTAQVPGEKKKKKEKEKKKKPARASETKAGTEPAQKQ